MQKLFWIVQMSPKYNYKCPYLGEGRGIFQTEEKEAM